MFADMVPTWAGGEAWRAPHPPPATCDEHVRYYRHLLAENGFALPDNTAPAPAAAAAAAAAPPLHPPTPRISPPPPMPDDHDDDDHHHDHEMLCDCAWTRVTGQSCDQTKGKGLSCWRDCCTPKAVVHDDL